MPAFVDPFTVPDLVEVASVDVGGRDLLDLLDVSELDAPAFGTDDAVAVVDLLPAATPSPLDVLLAGEAERLAHALGSIAPRPRNGCHAAALRREAARRENLGGPR